ncbi:MAG: hypothetical protein AB1411_03055 [Nitrospirota bacterium]|jgi:hypothetical protein
MDRGVKGYLRITRQLGGEPAVPGTYLVLFVPFGMDKPTLQPCPCEGEAALAACLHDLGLGPPDAARLAEEAKVFARATVWELELSDQQVRKYWPPV